MDRKLIRGLRKSIKANRTYQKWCIYLVGQDAIAKGKTENISKNEFKWGTYLRKNEVQVPEMYTIVNPDSLVSRILYPRGKIERWFVIMERLRGQVIGETYGATREEAVKQYRQELEKVLDLGICPNDSSWSGNSIFGEDEKLYLIDFESWKKGSERELNRFYETISAQKLNLEDIIKYDIR